MADNTVLNSMSGGDTIQTEDFGGAGKIQRIKIALGAKDIDALQDVTGVTPFPVIITNTTVSGTTVSGSMTDIKNFPTYQSTLTNITQVNGNTAFPLEGNTFADSKLGWMAFARSVGSGAGAVVKPLLVDPSGNLNVTTVSGSTVTISGSKTDVQNFPTVQTVNVMNMPAQTSVSGTQHAVIDNFPTSQTTNQGAPNNQANRWPTYLSDGNNPVGTPTNPLTVSGVMDLVANTPTMVSGIGTAVWQIKNTAAILDSYYIYNPNSSVMYLQLFDVASAGSVTLGTTVPKQSYGIPATSAANLATIALQFKNGLFIAATTTAGGSTGPTTGLDVNLGFK